MSEPGSLEALTILQSDLLALSQSRLHSVERLFQQLEENIVEFQKLLDRPPRKNESRQKLSTGKLELRDVEYEVNQEFQQGALQLADTLELDEIVAAQIFLDAQSDSISIGRSQHECSIIRFYKRQYTLLECLRIALELSLGIGLGIGVGEDVRAVLQQWVGYVLGAPPASSQFIHKCLKDMADSKHWLQRLTDKVNSASVLGQAQSDEFSEIIEIQRLHLVKQHELLGTIIYYLIKSNHSALSDLGYLLDIVKKIDKYDNLLVHYFPAVGASIQAWVHSDGTSISLDQIQPLYEKYFALKDDQSWPLHYVYTALSTWWLSEYIAWYDENSADPILANVDIVEVRNKLSDRLIETIKEGAFDFFMSMCAEVKPFSWKDPAQHEICEWIDHKGGSLSLPWQRIEHTTRSAAFEKAFISNPIRFSTDFEMALMEQMEMFVDAFICNAPNVLRKLRHDEDEQRQLGQTNDYDMDLEKFLVIVSFAFEGRHDAAMQAFWSDTDSHMHGFLIWASQRASTPLASAFNGMLRSISGNTECAQAAHEFLLDDSASSSGKMRKTQCLSWNFVLGELRYFNGALNERPASLHTTFYRTGKPHTDQDEIDALAAESLLMMLMLQSYLHLMTRICTQSSDARKHLLESTSFDVVEQLFRLVSIPTPRVPSHLRGCLFNTIEALCISKTRETSEVMWSAVEFWRSGGYFTQAHLPKVSAVGSTYNTTMDDVLRDMETGFEQANAFVRLLNILVLPDEGDELNDQITFPEGLGSSSRMPGISDYVDFVMRVFKNKTFDKLATKKSLEELNEMRVIRWSCLNFISTCLRSFNEDLLVFAEHSHVQVENAMRTSSLENYVRLHPFARVMEWLFNDSVMDALFAAVDQDVVEVGSAVAGGEPDSPLVVSLFAGIVTITEVLDMQQTYLNRVRPSLKNELTHHHMPVSNAAYGSFEDGILKHLSIISKLGQYCTANDDDLTLASLKLLEKLSTSSKLVSPTHIGSDRRLDRNKAVVALGLYDETEDISKTLTEYLRIDEEIDEDPSSTSYTIKASILSFLNTCVESLLDQPTVAHLLLGFQCGANALHVEENSPLDQDTSLFHQVLKVSVELPAGVSGSNVSSSLISIKGSCLRLLGSLWTSPLSSVFVTDQIRTHDFLTCIIYKELQVQVDTLWDGRSMMDPEFMYSTSAAALTEFLLHRASIFKFVAIELRLLATRPAPTYKQKIISTLLGATILPDGTQLSNSDVFDLFDFMDLEIESLPETPALNYLKDLDLGLCLENREGVESFNINKASQLVMLRCRELQNTGNVISPDVESQISTERELLLFYIKKMNHIESLRSARSIALKAWVQLMCMIVESGGLGENKVGFVLQCLQLILPKLEKYSSENAPDAIDLARLAKALLFSLDFGSQTLEMERKLAAELAKSEALQRGNRSLAKASKKGPLTEVTNERLFSLFRICIRAIHTPSASASFKQIFYGICYRYMTGLARSTSISAVSQRLQSMKTVKLAGDRLVEIVCDDAYAGEQECRISALLMLSALVTLARQGGGNDQEDSKHVTESLVRLNFIGILVDSIQNMPNELRDTSEQDTTSQIVYCKAKLSLLLQIAQTRYGAAHILNARLFRSVANSGLFMVDPDLGMDLVVPDQEKVHYELLLAIVRVINACVVSRGAQNEQTLAEGRKFVLGNKASMMAVMKKHAGIGAVDKALEVDIGDLAEAYMLLMSVTDFLKSEETVSRSKKPKVFT